MNTLSLDLPVPCGNWTTPGTSYHTACTCFISWFCILPGEQYIILPSLCAVPSSVLGIGEKLCRWRNVPLKKKMGGRIFKWVWSGLWGGSPELRDNERRADLEIEVKEHKSVDWGLESSFQGWGLILGFGGLFFPLHPCLYARKACKEKICLLLTSLPQQFLSNTRSSQWNFWRSGLYDLCFSWWRTNDRDQRQRAESGTQDQTDTWCGTRAFPPGMG